MDLRWLAAALMLLAGCTPTDPAPRRNIVIILTDDQRHDSLGFVNAYFETPR